MNREKIRVLMSTVLMAILIWTCLAAAAGDDETVKFKYWNKEAAALEAVMDFVNKIN